MGGVVYLKQRACPPAEEFNISDTPALWYSNKQNKTTIGDYEQIWRCLIVGGRQKMAVSRNLTSDCKGRPDLTDWLIGALRHVNTR